MSKPKNRAWLQITSGRGPDECALAVKKLCSRITKDAQLEGVPAEISDRVAGDKNGTYSSILICLSGPKAIAFSKPWLGSVQWICESPYRPRCKRKNWFVGLCLIEVSKIELLTLCSSDVTWKAMRASGPGGQHVNTTDSAVQAVHKPTGVQVSASDARSQHENKKSALEKLKAILLSRQQESLAKQKRNCWRKHDELERGSPVKVFVGMEFKER